MIVSKYNNQAVTSIFKTSAIVFWNRLYRDYFSPFSHTTFIMFVIFNLTSSLSPNSTFFYLYSSVSLPSYFTIFTMCPDANLHSWLNVPDQHHPLSCEHNDPLSSYAIFASFCFLRQYCKSKAHYRHWHRHWYCFPYWAFKWFSHSFRFLLTWYSWNHSSSRSPRQYF